MGLKAASIKVKVPEEGVLIDVPDWPGVKLKVRSIESRDYEIARQLLIAKKTRQLKRAPTPPELSPELPELIARHLLRGWEGLDGDDDRPLEYTPALGLSMVTDPEFSELRDRVVLCASLASEPALKFSEEASKNSPAPSAST